MRRKRISIDLDGLGQAEQVTVTWYTDKGARLEEFTYSPGPFDDLAAIFQGCLDTEPRQGSFSE